MNKGLRDRAVRTVSFEERVNVAGIERAMRGPAEEQ